jgi:hypothetical protein
MNTCRGDWRYRFTNLDLRTRWEWSASHPVRFASTERALGMHWIDKSGWASERVLRLRREKSLAPTVNRTPTVQSVARRRGNQNHHSGELVVHTGLPHLPLPP